MAIEGLDLCPDFQTKIDWQKVAAAGKRFVYLQASRYSNHLVAGYQELRAQAAAAGLAVAPYHFAYIGSDPVKQAEMAFKASGELGGIGSLRPMLDLEYSKGFTGDQVLAWMIPYGRRMTELTQRAQLACYTYPYYWHVMGPNAYASSEVRELFSLFMAGYKTDAQGKLIAWQPAEGAAPPIPGPWTTWWGWQYSGNNSQIPGVPGDADHDELNLTEEEFLIETGRAGVSTPKIFFDYTQ